MIDINILKQKSNLTIIDNKICVKPMNKYSFSTYPINEGDNYLAITVEDYLAFKAGYYMFTDDLDALTIRGEETIDNE